MRYMTPKDAKIASWVCNFSNFLRFQGHLATPRQTNREDHNAEQQRVGPRSEIPSECAPMGGFPHRGVTGLKPVTYYRLLNAGCQKPANTAWESFVIHQIFTFCLHKTKSCLAKFNFSHIA